MNIYSKINKYKIDIIVFSSLAILFFALLTVFWGHLGNIIIDCGKEAYYPQQMLQGKIFGKDLMAVYGPISFQINTILFMLFGDNLNILYASGAVNSFFILLLTYIISRQLISYEVTWIILFFIIVVFFFNNSVSNYIFPYTYAIIYAVTFFLLSILFCIFYIKYSRPLFIILSCLFLSVSIFSKYEFLPFLLVIAYIIFVYKPLQIKYVIYSVFSFFIVPFISIGSLLFQGLSINNLISYIELNVKLSQLQYIQQFYTYAVGFHPSKEMLLTTLNFLIYFFISFMILFITIYIILNEIKSFSYSLKCFIWVILLISLIITILDLSYIMPKILFIGFLSWLPLVNLLIFIFIFIKTFINFIKNNNDFKSNKAFPAILKLFKLDYVDNKTIIYLVLLSAAVVSTFKCLFYIGLEVYGPYLLLLPFIASTIFLIDYVLKMIKFANYQISKQACMLTILLFGLFFMFRTLIEIKNEVNYLVSTPYGSIYTSSIIGIPFMKAVEYINNNVTSSESILMLPEGVLLNFLTNRSAKSIHINLLPIETELFGEDNVIKDLKKSAPDYIFVNNRNYYNMIFGIHYGQKIFNYIARNYTFQTIYGKSFKIVIFKKNKLNSTVKN